jgi:hypothetical protein
MQTNTLDSKVGNNTNTISSKKQIGQLSNDALSFGQITGTGYNTNIKNNSVTFREPESNVISWSTSNNLKTDSIQKLG